VKFEKNVQTGKQRTSWTKRWYKAGYVALRRCVPRPPLPDRSVEETVAPDRPPAVRLDTLDTDGPDGESSKSAVSQGWQRASSAVRRSAGSSRRRPCSSDLASEEMRSHSAPTGEKRPLQTSSRVSWMVSPANGYRRVRMMCMMMPQAHRSTGGPYISSRKTSGET